jgi:hypothetical protein
LAAAMRRAATHPRAMAAANLRFVSLLARVGPVVRVRGGAPVPVEEKDRRFADPAWEDHPGYFALHQTNLAALALAEDVLAEPSTRQSGLTVPHAPGFLRRILGSGIVQFRLSDQDPRSFRSPSGGAVLGAWLPHRWLNIGWPSGERSHGRRWLRQCTTRSRGVSCSVRRDWKSSLTVAGSWPCLIGLGVNCT